MSADLSGKLEATREQVDEAQFNQHIWQLNLERLQDSV